MLLLPVSLAILACAAGETNTSYIITTPSVIRPLHPITFSISILHSVTASTEVHVELLQLPSNKSLVTHSAKFQPGLPAVLEMKAPGELSRKEYLLRVHGSGGVTFDQAMQVRAKQKSYSVFIQTDKPIYKPSQTVKFRVFAVQPDLKVHLAPITLKIWDKADNLMMQWKNQNSSTGVVSKEFELADQPPLGEWRIEAALGSEKTFKTFKVDEYVLPKFEVKVNLPSFMTGSTENLDGYIEAKYTFGQPVSGKVKYRVTRMGFDESTFEVEASLENGKVDFSIPKLQIDRLQGPNQRYYWGPKIIQIEANVTEEATGKILSGTGSVKYKRADAKIEILDSSPATFKKGMNYTVFIKISEPDENPPDACKNLMIDLSQRWTWTKEMGNVKESGHRTVAETLVVPASGLLVHEISVLDLADSLMLQAIYKCKGKSVSASKSVSIFNSRDDQSLQVSMMGRSSTVLPGQLVSFLVKASKMVHEYMVQIMSKGAIIASLQFDLDGKANGQFSINFDDAMARRASPNVRLVAWYFTEKGEVITDSIEFNVESTFQNQVSLNFNTNQSLPGQEVTLNVNAAPESFIGLLAVDQSVLLLGTGNDITQDDVKAELNKYDSGWAMYIFDPEVVLKRSMYMCRDCWWPIFVGGKDAGEMFSNAGLLVFTDAYIHKENEHYPTWPAEVDDYQVLQEDDDIRLKGAGMAKGKPRVRQIFPETWIWAEETAGADGKAALKYSTPDTMTSWVASAFALHGGRGLGIANDKGKITVFKPFFVSLTLPYSLIRSEEFLLKATVFNYLQNSQQVMVTLKQSQYFKVKIVTANGDFSPVNGDATRTLTVASNDAKTVSFWIHPTSLGKIPIEVHAQGPTSADALKREILIESEGSEKEITQSAFISLTETSDQKFVKTFKINLPPKGTLVPGSVFAQLLAVGDAMGGTLKNLKRLVKMPSGCGEQNMINFVPNIVAMKYMQATGQKDVNIESDAIKFMNRGYQKELTYQRDDGSFSAFGKQDDAGSTWLTAYVVKSFALAKKFITIDDKLLQRAVNYLLSTQQKDGSFVEKGTLHHQLMKGGVENKVALAAYIAIAAKMAEESVEDGQRLTTALGKATKYVEKHLPNLVKDPYSLPVAAYALTLVGSDKASKAVDMLMKSGQTDIGHLHWGKKADEKLPRRQQWNRRPEPSFNIEATGYGLLAMLAASRPLAECLPALRWLISKQNAIGGYSNTQDTVIAVDAMSEFGTKGSSVPNNGILNIVARIGGNEFRFEPITSDNRMLLQIKQLTATTLGVDVTATGLGTALVQLAIKYNVFDSSDDDNLVITKLDTKVVNNKKIVLETCAAWMSSEDSGMVNIETKALSGYEFETDSILEGHSRDGMKRVEVKDKILTTYWDRMTKDTQRCFQVTAIKMMDVVNIQKATVIAYSYYSTEQVTVQYYHPNISTLTTSYCTDCPSCCKDKASALLIPYPILLAIAFFQ